MTLCKNLVSFSIHFNQKMIDRKDVQPDVKSAQQCLNKIISMKSIVIPQLTFDQSQNLEELLTQELSDMDRAIQEAVNKLKVS